MQDAAQTAGVRNAAVRLSQPQGQAPGCTTTALTTARGWCCPELPTQLPLQRDCLRRVLREASTAEDHTKTTRRDLQDATLPPDLQDPSTNSAVYTCSFPTLMTAIFFLRKDELTTPEQGRLDLLPPPQSPLRLSSAILALTPKPALVQADSTKPRRRQDHPFISQPRWEEAFLCSRRNKATRTRFLCL